MAIEIRVVSFSCVLFVRGNGGKKEDETEEIDEGKWGKKGCDEGLKNPQQEGEANERQRDLWRKVQGASELLSTHLLSA